MSRNKLVLDQVSSLDCTPTSHNRGLKRVIMNASTLPPITQVAMGEMQKGEKVCEHSHDTMVECYYILSGFISLVIDGELFECKKDSFACIPNKVNHILIAKTDVKFLYWGIAITEESFV